MKKKILIGSIFAVFMLVSISFSVAAISSQSTAVEKKKDVSPLFGIRAKKAIGEKLSSIKAKFLGERVFFRPFNLIGSMNFFSMFERQNLNGVTNTGPTMCGACPTWQKTCFKCEI